MPFRPAYASASRMQAIRARSHEGNLVMVDSVTDLASKLVDEYAALDPKVILSDGEIAIVQLDAASVFRRLDNPIWLILVSASTLERQLATDLNWLDRHVLGCLDRHILGCPTAVGLFPILLCPPGPSVQAAALIANTLFADEPVFSVAELLGKSGSVRASEALRDALLQHASIEQLSPYRIDICTSNRMFFGRGPQIERIRRSQGNHLIVGPRRIGKSSLAVRLQKELGTVNRGSFFRGGTAKPMNRCSFLDVSSLGVGASEWIWGHILRGFSLERRDFAALGRKAGLVSRHRGDDREGNVDEARALQTLISQVEGRLTIILDEVDGWLRREASTGWTAIDRLRAMTDDGKAKVILIGYESLEAAAGSDRFPLAARGDITRLGPLERDAIDELVVVPMSELKLRLEPERWLLDRIWDATSGLPHIVQDICSQLVSACNVRGKKTQVVRPDLLKVVLHSSAAYTKFRKGVLNSDFPLAEMIAGITSVKGKDVVFSNREIVAHLEEVEYTYDSDEFALALSYLELRSVFQPVDVDRVQWTWVNRNMREAMAASIAGVGYERWLLDRIRRHREGSWRKRYQVLGRAIADPGVRKCLEG
jgi:hypothetical protein